MTRFAEILRSASHRLDLSQPTKSHVLLELAADLEDLFLPYRGQGQDEEGGLVHAPLVVPASARSRGQARISLGLGG